MFRPRIPVTGYSYSPYTETYDARITLPTGERTAISASDPQGLYAKAFELEGAFVAAAVCSNFAGVE